MKRLSCKRCLRPLSACLCSVLPEPCIDNCWPVYILQHRQERSHALNTAHIAALGLATCQLHTVDDAAVETTLPAALLAELEHALLIYPGAHSRNVTELNAAKLAPCPLLLLDGSWRKSRRMLLASPWLQALPRIGFVLQSPSRYRIRREPHANYCSSVEALCAVLGSLERDDEKNKSLLATMDVIIEQQVEHMGEATFRRNYAREHD